MRVFYHIKQSGLIFLEKRKNWILFFFQNGRSSKHVESTLSIPYRDRVAHCFKLAIAQCAALAEQPTRQQRLQSSGSQSVFNFLFCTV